ncbi:hypothetical protein QF035_005803 [Streptomyces umbrinus]|uniref:DNA-binding protein n=2 Tax=Streptomyces umbrinus TaxID=67370 RepID=A0ABU0SXD8_9ACTN|nr:hypothetical protein [Streptomyces umbrinus]
MAYAQPSPALPRPTHPMAKTGYGKRAVGDEPPHADTDFAHLCPRDAEFAVFIDHLDDGHAMGHKVIAAEHPRYGQQASRTSLRSLTEAGHLRWIKEHITVEDNSMRWVTRTYWSRTPRSVEWWTEFARERHGRDVTQNHQPGLARTEASAPAPQPVSEAEKPERAELAEQAEQPDSAPEPSAAYRALAGLRAADPRMPLSEAECRALEPLAAEWLSRGATPADMIRALTDGLPPAVANPGGFVRTRLENKMPPQKNDTAETGPGRPLRAKVTRVIMACATCDADERTAKIVRGVCEDCLAEEAELGMTQEDVKKGFEEIAHMGTATARLLKLKLERRTGGPVPDTFRPVPIEDRVHYHYRDNRDRIANGLPPRRWKP